MDADFENPADPEQAELRSAYIALDPGKAAKAVAERMGRGNPRSNGNHRSISEPNDAIHPYSDDYNQADKGQVNQNYSPHNEEQ